MLSMSTVLDPRIAEGRLSLKLDRRPLVSTHMLVDILVIQTEARAGTMVNEPIKSEKSKFIPTTRLL